MDDFGLTARQWLLVVLPSALAAVLLVYCAIVFVLLLPGAEPLVGGR